MSVRAAAAAVAAAQEPVAPSAHGDLFGRWRERVKPKKRLQSTRSAKGRLSSSLAAAKRAPCFVAAIGAAPTARSVAFGSSTSAERRLDPVSHFVPT